MSAIRKIEHMFYMLFLNIVFLVVDFYWILQKYRSMMDLIKQKSLANQHSLKSWPRLAEKKAHGKEQLIRRDRG